MCSLLGLGVARLGQAAAAGDSSSGQKPTTLLLDSAANHDWDHSDLKRPSSRTSPRTQERKPEALLWRPRRGFSMNVH